MKSLSEAQGLEKLQRLKTNYQKYMRENYEHKAKDCLTCDVQGDCCLDAHFVNVQITRLEAVAIRRTLDGLGREKRNEIYSRIDETVEKYDLADSEDSFDKTFACPLFEQGSGCLVHYKGKPIPCIQHACYEKKADVPPDQLRTRHEKAVDRLNWQVYGNGWNWLPLPVWIQKVATEGTENTEGF